MSNKAKPPAKAPTDSTDTLKVPKDPCQSEAAQMAAIALGSIAANAMTARAFAMGNFGTLDITECALVLRQRAKSTLTGDLAHAETTLTAQAATLDVIFNELARRAAANMGQHLDATERYMRLALKAQGQCRATLETLVAIKNPPVVFAKQANIAHGPQQVNNGTAAAGSATHAKKTRSRQNELLEDHSHGSTQMDDRATPAPARGHPAVETLEPVHRPNKPRRKGSSSA